MLITTTTLIAAKSEVCSDIESIVVLYVGTTAAKIELGKQTFVQIRLQHSIYTLHVYIRH